MGANQDVTLLLWGHVALVLCFVFYLLWWWVFFCPRDERPSGAMRLAGIASIACAAVCGIAGIGLNIAGITTLGGQTCFVAPWQIAMGGMVAYVALFFITSVVLDRPPTSELLIITAWATLELAVMDVLHGAGAVQAPAIVVLIVLLALLVIVSLICYLQFYKLEGKKSFVCGAIPLVCAIVFDVAAGFVIALS